MQNYTKHFICTSILQNSIETNLYTLIEFCSTNSNNLTQNKIHNTIVVKRIIENTWLSTVLENLLLKAALTIKTFNTLEKTSSYIFTNLQQEKFSILFINIKNIVLIKHDIFFVKLINCVVLTRNLHEINNLALSITSLINYFLLKTNK
jgi:hypothetical protein